MVEVLTRKMCKEVGWSGDGITFEFYGDDDAFILGMHVLFENRDYLVRSCRFTRFGMGGFCCWHVELG